MKVSALVPVPDREFLLLTREVFFQGLDRRFCSLPEISDRAIVDVTLLELRLKLRQLLLQAVEIHADVLSLGSDPEDRG